MVRRIVIFSVLCCSVFAAATQAQVATTRSGGGRGADGRPPIELGGFYGYSWTWSQDTYLYDSGTGQTTYGNLDIKDSGFWGVNLNYPLRPDTWLELLYSNQSSDLVFKRVGDQDLETKLKVEYYQIGAVRALRKDDRVVPFTSLSLGWTTVKATEAGGQSESNFSMVIGVGAKIYASERIGLRVQARLPVTFTSGGLGFGFGTGGASAGFYGTGVTQTDVSAGAFLRF